MASYVGRWNEQDMNAMAVLWRDGLSCGVIAQRLGRTRSSVCGLMNRHRDLFPRRNDHLHRPLVEKPLKTPRKRKFMRPSRIMAAPLVLSVGDSRHADCYTKTELRAQITQAVLNTK